MGTISEAAARAAHEVNRAYCLAIGDGSHLAWEHAPDWQKSSARNGVLGVIAGNTPEQSHESWLAEKRAAGWGYGPVKDPDKKTHPCFLPYAELPPGEGDVARAADGLKKMNKGVRLLDHGYLKIVDWMGSDKSIIEAARMSTGKGFEGWGPIHEDGCAKQTSARAYIETELYGQQPDESDVACTCTPKAGDERLLKYLYENRHDTPFEMVELVVEVQAPIMVFREWMRHRTQAFNEMSARYVQMPNLHYVPTADRIIAASRKHRNKQQGGGGELKLSERIQALEESAARSVGRSADFGEAQIAAHVRAILHAEQQSIYDLYEELLAMGIAPEVARIDTPVSRYSRMRAKANLRNWLAFLTLRSDAAAQWEIRQYAYGLGYFIARLFPRTWALWLNADRRKPEIDRTGFLVVEAA